MDHPHTVRLARETLLSDAHLENSSDITLEILDRRG